MIDGLDRLVSSAVSTVFGTMLNLSVSEQPDSAALTHGEPHIAGSVVFVGAVSGIVFLYSTVKFARTVAGKMLRGDQQIASDEMVNDAFGEIANMVVGNLKSRLCDRGLPCALTIPSILRGSDLTIEPTSSSTRRVSTFRSGEGDLVVEVLIKASDKRLAA
jgi:chemotaxis protein CheX